MDSVGQLGADAYVAVNVGCGGNMRPEYFADNLRRFLSFAHRSKENPGLYVAGGSGDDDFNYTEVVMKNAAAFIDGMSWHYYTRPNVGVGPKSSATGFDRQGWVDSLATALKMETWMQGHLAAMDKHDPAKRVGLYIDEWGAWYEVEKGTDPNFLYQQNSLRDAVLAAATLNIFHRHADRVKMTSIAQTVNVLQSMILTDGAEIALTPTYLVYKMYVPFQDATSIPVELATPTLSIGGTTLPALSGSAARAKNGKIYLALTNLDPEHGLTLAVQWDSGKIKRVSGDLLTASTLDAHNTPGRPAEVTIVPYTQSRIRGPQVELDIPAKSVVVVALE